MGAGQAFGITPKIFAIDGISDIYAHTYKITIDKGKMYTWEEIMIEIKKITKEFAEFIKTFDMEKEIEKDQKKQGQGA